MIIFERNLTSNQIDILEAVKVHTSHHDYHFGRCSVISLENLIKALTPPENDDEDYYIYEYKTLRNKALIMLYEVKNFLKSENLSKLLETVKNVDEQKREDNFGSCSTRYSKLYHTVNLAKSIEKRKNLKEDELHEFIKNWFKPNYTILKTHSGLDWSDSKFERIVQELYGIISIEKYKHYYDDIFIPKHLYNSKVESALKDEKHRFIITIKDDLHIDILNFIYTKTKSLKSEYGASFRVEFSRPEICKHLDMISMLKQSKFRKLMKPLEGIVGRIERKKEYSKPTWFLSLKHQNILDEIVRYKNEGYQ